jgi:hypothetical protein
MRRSARDTGSIVAGWIAKLAICLGVVGILLFDAISIGTTYVSTADAGDTAAQAGSESWIATHDVRRAYATALAEANRNGHDYTINPKTFVVETDGTVHLVIARKAHTLVVERVGPVRQWASVERQATARYNL